MFKKVLIILSSALLFLSACNKNDDPNTNSSENGSSTTDWTDSQKGLMNEYLNGVVIPFISLPLDTTNLTYYDEYGCLSVESVISTIEEANGYRDQYASILNNTDGYVLVDHDVDSNNIEYYDYSLDVGIDYIDLQFYSLDSNGTIYFCIDCYYTERTNSWPIDSVNNFINECTPTDWNDTINIPSLTGGDIYEVYEYFDFSYLSIEVISDNYVNLASAYEADLISANFVYDENEEAYILSDSISKSLLYSYVEADEENSSLFITFLFY